VPRNDEQLGVQTELDLQTEAAASTLPVTARELHQLRFDRRVLERMRKKCLEMEAKIDEREARVIARIEAGAEVEGDAQVVTRQRTTVSWFSVCRREMGDEFIQAERQTWPVTTSKALKLGGPL
jgi:hypothetical protein